MYAAQECRFKAEYFGKLAESAKTDDERNRLLRMKRSYELMARSREFSAALDQTIQRLKR
jgi:hypothetical protein